MKTSSRLKLIVPILLVLFAFFGTASAASVTVYDSVISLATNATKNYTFTDSASGQSIVVAVTMTPYSSLGMNPVFSLLDGDTRVGVNSGTGEGDGNLILLGEGVNFSATLISASSGVARDSIQFGIADLGLRAPDGTSGQSWISSVTSSNAFVITNEVIYALDTNLFSLAGENYSGELRFTFNDGSDYQLSDAGTNVGQSVRLVATFTATNLVTDPRTNTWFTTYGGQYARIYTNDASKMAGKTLATWTNGTTIQSLPAYCGVQEIYSSSNWVYIRSTGLGSFVMGPWYLNAAHTQAFPNWPVNQKIMYRIPRNPSVPATKTANSGGAIGYFVDGAAMFNSWDAYTWSTVSNTDAQNITGYWNRDAYVNEGVSFDANNAHQAGGQYHYHANPPELRYQLGDHVDFNSTAKTYTESTNATAKHSPILAWTADGYPLYGPYGYANATNANSGVRRMISGYVLRNGQDGTENLTSVGRIHLPQWAVRLFNVSSNQNGAPFTGLHTNGCYMEDNDYLGDCINPNTGTNYQQGVDFDLDEYNERWCVTPEFPQGTHAYFVSINSKGTPVFPYNIGRGFYGSPVGGTVASISETVVTNFLGNTNLASTLNAPTVGGGQVTLTWSALEGGSYQVEATTNLTSWGVLATGVTPNQITGDYTNFTAVDKRFYRVGRNSVASYDSAGTTLFSTNCVAPGGAASRGQSVELTITLPTGGGYPPNAPPAGVPITSVTVGSLTALSASCTAQGTVVALFTIPSGYTPTGAQTVTVNFKSPAPTYTLASYFTVN